ncbi:MAG: CDP-alcohol phosphatidyltransferase family protein, partial [Myxococcales bacterium]|nr:CDP-alcohol phosphatidyltransferase family protein [Myxococcales bacterium]
MSLALDEGSAAAVFASSCTCASSVPRGPEPCQVDGGLSKRTLLGVSPPRRGRIRDDAVNLPNLLTMVRIVLIPLVLYLLAGATPAANFWAVMVYSVCTITDFVDGWIARRQGLESVLGKFLDPL